MSKEDEALISSLDEAAKHLLAMAGVSDKVAGEAPKPVATLAEQVKAFEAVVDWAKTRRGLKPAPKPESKFDGIKQQFNGTAPVRRGSSARRPKKAEAPGDGATGATDVAGPDGADNLFGAEET